MIGLLLLTAIINSHFKLHALFFLIQNLKTNSFVLIVLKHASNMSKIALLCGHLDEIISSGDEGDVLCL